MRIAAIIPGVPEPRDRGTYKRYAAMVAMLRRLGEVDCCALRDGESPPGAVERFAAAVSRFHLAPLRFRRWKPLPLQLLDPLAPMVRHWFDPAAVPDVRAFFAGRDYDLVFLGDLVSLPYARVAGLDLARAWIDRGRVDLEFQRQKIAVAKEHRSLGQRVGDRCRLVMTARYERIAARAVAGEVVCAESDARALRACVGDRIAVRVVANGIERADFPDQGEPPAAPAVMFTGAMDYVANVDGLHWFVSEAWPQVRARFPAATLTVVGQNPIDSVQALDGRDGLRVTGGVPAMPPWYRQARCVVAPIRIGGGTRLKVVECWSVGRPLVGTRIAFDGLDARDGDNALLADDARGLAEATCAVLGDDALTARLRRGALAAGARYAWEAVTAPLEAEWRAAPIPTHPASAGAA